MWASGLSLIQKWANERHGCKEVENNLVQVVAKDKAWAPSVALQWPTTWVLWDHSTSGSQGLASANCQVFIMCQALYVKCFTSIGSFNHLSNVHCRPRGESCLKSHSSRVRSLDLGVCATENVQYPGLYLFPVCFCDSRIVLTKALEELQGRAMSNFA